MRAPAKPPITFLEETRIAMTSPARLVDDALLARFQTLATPTLANALDDVAFEGVLQGLMQVVPGTRCVGRAVTIRQIAGERGDFTSADFRVGAMIDAANPGDIIVIDNGGKAISTFGGLATLAGQGGSFRSAGDLAYHEGNLFLSSTNRQLVKLNKITGAPISSKLHNIANLFGLVSTGTNRLYGFADTQAYLLNEDTGGKTPLFQFAGRGLAQIYGAAFNGNFQS